MERHAQLELAQPLTIQLSDSVHLAKALPTTTPQLADHSRELQLAVARVQPGVAGEFLNDLKWVPPHHRVRGAAVRVASQIVEERP